MMRLETTQHGSELRIKVQLQMVNLKVHFKTDLTKAHGTNTPITATS